MELVTFDEHDLQDALSTAVSEGIASLAKREIRQCIARAKGRVDADDDDGIILEFRDEEPTAYDRHVRQRIQEYREERLSRANQDILEAELLRRQNTVRSHRWEYRRDLEALAVRKDLCWQPVDLTM